MKTSRVDFHTHVFPDIVPNDSLLGDRIDQIRSQARKGFSWVSKSLHAYQPLVRHLPDPLVKAIDLATGVLPASGLLIESGLKDFEKALDGSKIDHALVIAHEPFISNDFVMALAQKTSRILPVVNIHPDTPRPLGRLKQYLEKGAVALKIHPASDGLEPESSHYKKLLELLQKKKPVPVILHTGCFHSPLFYKKPKLGEVMRFQKMISQNPELKFVLAHMNMHEPNLAMDLACEFQNVYLDTSWQPTEVIAEAVRRVGDDRILFGSDWPFLGNTISVGISRVEEGMMSGLFDQNTGQKILGLNALKLLGIGEHSA